VVDVNRDLGTYQLHASPALREAITGRVAELGRISREVKARTPGEHADSITTIDGVIEMVGSLGAEVAAALAGIDRHERTAKLVESVETVDKIVDFSRHNVDAYVAQELRNMVTLREATVRDNRRLHVALEAFILVIGAGTLMLGIFFADRAIVRPLGKVIAASRELAEGRFEHSIALRRQDEIGDLAGAFREMQGVFNRVLRETATLFDAFRGGQMDVRGDASAFQGSFRQLVLGINNVIDVVASHSGELERANQALVAVNDELSATNELLEAQNEERRRAQRERDAMQADLLATARKAGMAEIATSVLHNIGNALNSVNIAAEQAREIVQASKVKDVTRLADLLEQHRADLGAFVTSDERGKLIPMFVRRLSGVLAEEQERATRELDELKRMVDHVKDILTWQQSYAGVAGVTEEIAPSELVEDALRIARVERTRDHIAIEKDIAEVPAVRVERHKVVQILVNLISNARHAIQDAGRDKGVITIKVRPQGSDEIAFEIADNGLGIPPENMDRLFQYGFTTRAEGHGFGLHSGSLTAAELRGSLQAASDGTGKGARFMLTLPLVDDREQALAPLSRA
jgi:signal transduction histidine kinase